MLKTKRITPIARSMLRRALRHQSCLAAPKNLCIFNSPAVTNLTFTSEDALFGFFSGEAGASMFGPKPSPLITNFVLSSKHQESRLFLLSNLHCR